MNRETAIPESVETIRRFADGYNERTLHDDAEDIFAPDVVLVNEGADLEVRGIDEFLAHVVDGWVTANPDAEMELVDYDLRDGRLAATLVSRGTFTGELETPDGTVSGTGESFETEFPIEADVVNGRITRWVSEGDIAGWRSQVGLNKTTEPSESGHERAPAVSASEVIKLPVSDVFTFFAENHHQNHPRWDPDIEMELETDGPVGVGSVLRRRNTRYEEPVEGTMEVTEFEENESFRTVIREGGFEMGGGATFEELGPNETRLTLETTVPESIDPEMIRNGMQRSVQTIKELAESDFESQ